MFIALYFIVVLVVAYTHAHGCFIKGTKYPWKEYIILCVLWPVTLPLGIWMIVSSEGRP